MDGISLRRKVYEALDRGMVGNGVTDAVHGVLIGLILVNVLAAVLESVPALAAAHATLFKAIEIVSVAVFTVEYAARLWSAVEHAPLAGQSGLRARLGIAASPAMIIDLVAILPFYLSLAVDIDLRFLLLLRLLRFLKLARYSPGFTSLIDAVWNERRALGASLLIFLSALLFAASAMRLAEHEAQPDKFGTIPDAMWWAVITLTTVGYGDVYPITTAGKMVAGVTAMLGIAMLALPCGIIATAFAREIQRRDFVVTWSMVAGVPLFSGLDATAVADIMRALRSETFEPGEVICRRGEPAHSMFVVAEGEVLVEADAGRTVIGPGQCFGEAAAFERATRGATLRARNWVKVLSLDTADLHHLMQENPAIGVVIRAVIEEWRAPAGVGSTSSPAD
ncbi:cyclic nucleotide-gated ion channel [Phreatobacter stygius]|uniref:Cyclic nucleotide-binding domain-containing protein n=1 Tax=Phreatobacter stygius TaxID=1940610 RepID=A0A4D7B4F3_9HYPH|nr:cyclic nucleotide-gated ion channel [Phreatobacter stygius]QCI62897.1 cyclic nucleotide-binding domain-containing protein [Phreatobacter stygius]